MRFCEEHLGTMARIKAIYRNRPVLSLDDARCVLAKHGLGRAVGVEVLGATPYFMNFVYRVNRDDGPPVVLKGQHLPAMGWDVSQEALVIPLLRKGTSLPLPDWALYDGDRDALAWPYALIAWLDGRSTLEVYEESDLDTRCALAEAHGAVHRAIHDCPVPDGAGPIEIDVRRWQRLVEELLFADDGQRAALALLCPGLEDEVRRRLARAREVRVEAPPVVAWRDGSLGNTMARPDRHGRPRLCGVFDFQGAVFMQRRWDLSKAFSAFVPGTDPDREPTPEWEAFCRGYGSDARRALDGAEAQAFAAVYPALQVRHWWEPFGLFHPRTPGWIEDLLAALDRLARGA